MLKKKGVGACTRPLCLVTLCLLLSGARAKSSGAKNTDAHIATPDYPSQYLDFYLPYYTEYFTAAGFRYARQHLDASRTVSKCVNQEPYFGNDTVLGEFPCPMERDPADHGYCCGAPSLEYCCKRHDTVRFKLMVGCIVAAILGVLLFIAIFIAIRISKTKNTIKRKRSGLKQMSENGIPRYEGIKLKHLNTKQSDDGYHVFVHFKSKNYYDTFWKELYSVYSDIAWRFSETNEGGHIKEGKITQEDGTWVTLVLNDNVDGHAVIVVSREKAAVAWMEGPFLDILEKIPESGGCGCFRHKKTHPNKH